MNKIFVKLLFVLLFLGGNAVASDFYPEKTAERLVQSTLKNKSISLGERMEIMDSNLKNELIVVYKIIDSFPEDERFAIFTQALGRYDLFDYLIIVNNNAVIEKVDVIKYRSEHGGEIASKKWLNQFENYSSGELKYGDDISAISGATISAKSITADIPIIIKLFKKQRGEN